MLFVYVTSSFTSSITQRLNNFDRIPFPLSEVDDDIAWSSLKNVFWPFYLNRVLIDTIKHFFQTWMSHGGCLAFGEWKYIFVFKIRWEDQIFF